MKLSQCEKWSFCSSFLSQLFLLAATRMHRHLWYVKWCHIPHRVEKRIDKAGARAGTDTTKLSLLLLSIHASLWNHINFIVCRTMSRVVVVVSSAYTWGWVTVEQEEEKSGSKRKEELSLQWKLFSFSIHSDPSSLLELTTIWALLPIPLQCVKLTRKIEREESSEKDFTDFTSKSINMMNCDDDDVESETRMHIVMKVAGFWTFWKSYNCRELSIFVSLHGKAEIIHLIMPRDAELLLHVKFLTS